MASAEAWAGHNPIIGSCTQLLVHVAAGLLRGRSSHPPVLDRTSTHTCAFFQAICWIDWFVSAVHTPGVSPISLSPTSHLAFHHSSAVYSSRLFHRFQSQTQTLQQLTYIRVPTIAAKAEKHIHMSSRPLPQTCHRTRDRLILAPCRSGVFLRADAYCALAPVPVSTAFSPAIHTHPGSPPPRRTAGQSTQCGWSSTARASIGPLLRAWVHNYCDDHAARQASFLMTPAASGRPGIRSTQIMGFIAKAVVLNSTRFGAVPPAYPQGSHANPSRARMPRGELRHLETIAVQHHT